MRAILLLILALLQPAPNITAHWQGSHVARISWRQPASVQLTCLSRNSTLIQCWSDLPPGLSVVELGKTGPLDAAFRPAAGDVYVVQQDGAVWKAPLRGVAYFPVWR